MVENAQAIQHKIASKRFVELGGKSLCVLSILLTMSLVFSLIAMVGIQGIASFFKGGVNFFDFLCGREWAPSLKDASGLPLAGALPMILGSFAVTLCSTLVAAPLAIGAAIYVVEIQPEFGRRYFQPAVELLVGIPSVVYGLIGLSVVVPAIRTVFGGSGYGILSGSMVLSLMVLPTITSLAIDGLSAVPQSYRQGALALGSTTWQTIYKVVIRAAMPSLMTSVILGMARAFGEALAVQMIIGNAAVMPENLFTPASTLTSVLTMGMGNTIAGSLENNLLWSLALLLMLMSLAFIACVRYIGYRGSLESVK